MARIKPIRITENDRKEFAKLAKNSKAKISRTKNKYGLDLSDKLEIPTIDSFSTRKDFNEWKEKASSFTNRHNLTYQFVKNPYDVVASKKEINEITRDTKKAQRVADQLAKEAKNKPFISGGKQQGTVGQQMLQMGKPNMAGIVRPKDFDFQKVRNRDQLKSKKKNMKERTDPKYFDERMRDMKTNFMKMLHNAFNSDANDLVENLTKIPDDVFYDMYLQFDEFSFNEYYAVEGEDTGDEAHLVDLRRMEKYVQQYFDGTLNVDLKNYPK